MKKTILIVADKKTIDKYKIQSFFYFKNNDDLENYTLANYARKFIAILEEFFLKKYGSVINASESDIHFFRNNRKNKEVPDRYIITEYAQLTLLLEKEFVDRFYNLMNTYYRNELRDTLSCFSFSLFIVDVLDIMEDFVVI